MRAIVTAAALSLPLAALAGSACAMNEGGGSWSSCRVLDAEKLAPGSGGAEALCSAIREAAEERGMAEAFTVELRVHSPSMLVATVTRADGRQLPEQRLASSDRPLGRSSFERFARNLVRQALGD